MRFVLLLLAIVVVSGMAQWWLPWYSLALVAAAAAFLLPVKPGAGFLAGFLAGCLQWGVYAAWLSAANEGILAARMGKLFGDAPGVAMVLATALLAGLVAGMGALTGSLGRKLVN